MGSIDFLTTFDRLLALSQYAEWLDQEFPWPDAEEVPVPALEAHGDVGLKGEAPAYVRHPNHGWMVTHNFYDGEGDSAIRMICWSEIGEAALAEIAASWWRDLRASKT